MGSDDTNGMGVIRSIIDEHVGSDSEHGNSIVESLNGDLCCMEFILLPSYCG